MLSPDCHILLLEDDPGIASLVSTVLRQAGFSHVRTSSSIAGARQCWHAQLGKFDVFISDFSLPDGCAADFLSELLRYKPDLRVILMSGYSEEALEIEGSLLRRLVVLQKPFQPSELLDAMLAGANPSAPSALC